MSDLYDALKRAASWLAFIDKGLRTGKIPDQAIIDTRSDGAPVDVVALSTVIHRELVAASTALSQHKGAGDE